MHKRIISLIFISLSCHIAYAQKSQLAIFVYNSNSTTPTNALRSQLTNSFIEGGNSDYEIVDRTDEILDLLISEYRYQGSGMVKDDNIISAGEHLGANFICVIAITKYPEPDGYFFESKIVDVAKRQIIKNALYPNDEQQAVTSMGVKKQLEIAKSLAKQLGLYFDAPKQKMRAVGDTYAIINGKEYKVGYIDETGCHGIAFSVSDSPSNIPENKNVPSIKQLNLIYTNKEQLGLLMGEYWSIDEMESLKNTRTGKKVMAKYLIFDFATGESKISNWVRYDFYRGTDDDYSYAHNMQIILF